MSLTVKQAAAQLGISPALVYALVERRKIRHERHGLGRGTIRIPETALDEYRRSREFGPRLVARPRRSAAVASRTCGCAEAVGGTLRRSPQILGGLREVLIDLRDRRRVTMVHQDGRGQGIDA